MPLKSVELFAGGGGLALGLEQAGFEGIEFVEFDHAACETLRLNRPQWNVVEGDVHEVNFHEYAGKVDLVSGEHRARHSPMQGRNSDLVIRAELSSLNSHGV